MSQAAASASGKLLDIESQIRGGNLSRQRWPALSRDLKVLMRGHLGRAQRMCLLATSAVDCSISEPSALTNANNSPTTEIRSSEG